MSDNKRVVMSLTETDIDELRHLMSCVGGDNLMDHDRQKLLLRLDKWGTIFDTVNNIMSCPVPIHFTDLGTEP